MLRQLCWEVDTYGCDVVEAFGAYCAQQARILRWLPRLRRDLQLVSKMIAFLEDGRFVL